nr:MAG TPA: YopX protein [Caudoviricetes sp.]
MREILFKAKRICDGEWVEGYYLRDRYHIGGKDIIFYRKDSDRFTVYTDIIDPETLCQFTGLYDRNGKKIWENDIFQCADETMVTQKDLIEYNETHASFVRLRNTKKLGLQYLWIDEAICNHGEVIGNIFDNPELLQEESDE